MKKLSLIIFIVSAIFTFSAFTLFNNTSSGCPYLEQIKTEEKSDCPYLETKPKNNKKSECPYLKKEKGIKVEIISV